MSQLAQMFALDRAAVPVLVEAAQPKGKRKKLFRKSTIEPANEGFREAFQSLTRPVEVFEWSGYYFAVLLPFLDERGITLYTPELNAAARVLDDAFEAAALFFTPDHAEELRRLDPGAPDQEELRRYFEEFNEYEDPDAGRAMNDALDMLRRHLRDLDGSSVLLLIVG